MGRLKTLFNILIVLFSRWVPVDKKLPKPHNVVLIKRGQQNHHFAMIESAYKTDGGRWISYSQLKNDTHNKVHGEGVKLDPITHWKRTTVPNERVVVCECC